MMTLPLPQIADDRRRSALVVGVGAAVFTAFVVGSGLQSGGLRGGEASSIATSWRSWASVFAVSTGSFSDGFVYRVGLKIWMFGGTSTGWLRASSALGVVATVGIVAWLATRLVNRAAGFVSAAVLVFSGTVLELGQYVRFYAPVMALAAACLGAWTAELGRPRRWSLAIWGVCSVLLVGCSVMAGAIVLGQLLSLFALDPSHRCWRRRLGVAAVPLIVCVIVTTLTIGQQSHAAFNQMFGPAEVADLLYLVTGSGGWQGLLAYSVVGLVALGAVLHVVRNTTTEVLGDTAAQVFRPMILAPWFIVATGLFVMLCASIGAEELVGRFPAFLIPAAALALGCGIGLELERQRPKMRLERRSIAGVALPRAISPLRSNRQVGGVLVLGVALAVGSVGGSQGWRDWRSSQRIDWAPVVTAVSLGLQPGDVVLYGNESVRLSFRYYARRDPKLILPGPRSENQRIDLDTVRDAMNTHNRVWLIVETPLMQHPSQEFAVVLDRFHPTLVRSFGLTAVVYRIDIR